MTKKAKNTTWKTVRMEFNEIHLWLGLIGGLVIIPVCLTGTIYTYNSEIREAFKSHLYKVENLSGMPAISPDELLQAVGQESAGNINAIQLFDDPSRSVQVTVREEGDKSRFGTTFFLNPYTGQILGTSKEKHWIDEFMGNMFSLHRWMLLDKIEAPIFDELPNRTLGSYITGAATILFTLGLLTGMVIWFPQKLKGWKQGLKVKWKANWKRLNFDLHNTLAFYSLIFLLCMGLTGPFWSFPWYKDGWQKFWGTYQENTSQRGGGGPGREAGAPSEAAELLPLRLYIARADEVLDYRGDYRISLPSSLGQAVSVQKNRVGFFAPSAGDRIELDQSTGMVHSVELFREKPWNERMSRSIKALHIGDVYGQFTKLLYFLSCLVATSLPITGTIIWINKLKKKKPKKVQRFNR
ncbi:PepSY domain-containing protein [Litoribacter alkaliphilus]|uniref:PepSY domain-containing protein n=1 Tax=Litoribacter ruber TaxID=702568 RepID=A0AAP2CL26_9BACT|nr:PepSY-associated TM helix domain-containing protein [Litoribacter alkaliphilus]MBS9523812.1 PepSY domain-containing protein [Litoribacter alkaliphilus]